MCTSSSTTGGICSAFPATDLAASPVAVSSEARTVLMDVEFRWRKEKVMIGKLLLRGMLAGLVAAFLSFGVLNLAGEPAVDRAIAFESQTEEAKAAVGEAAAAMQPAPMKEDESELVSRPVQKGIGLLTAVVVYSSAFGGLFALVFAFAYRGMGNIGPRATSALLAAAGFIGVYFVPMLKYPANPPAVGLPETIEMRTSLYFAMILISIAAMIAAGTLRQRLVDRLGGWNAAAIAAGAYIVVMIGVALALPDVNEIPEGFPATVLWQFRIASLGGQAVMWTALGLIFGVLAEKVVDARRFALRYSLT